MVRKKKTVGEDAADTLTNTPSNGWPIISQGTHLIVKTFEDGSTELIWDHDQLLKEVIEATNSTKKSKAKAK